jgi:predicted RNA-binding Zn ribbon-like protein
MTPAPGEDRSPALALVNTLRSDAIDDLSTVESTQDWLESRSLRVRVRSGDIARLARLRAAVRDLFTAIAEQRQPARESVRLINEAAVAIPTPRLVWSANGPRRIDRAVRSVDQALAVLAADAIDAVGGERAALIRCCEAHGCIRLFLREHARRRWCSTTCGDRVRASRHYQRQKGNQDFV